MTVKITKPELNLREKISELDKPSGVAGEAMLRAETPQEQFNLIGAGRKNLLINGAFQVWQRGTSSTSFTGSTRGYIADRWSFRYATSAERSTDVPDGEAFKYSLKVVVESTSPDSFIIQGIEDSDRFAGQTVTLSYWIKPSETCTLRDDYFRSAQGTHDLNGGVWQKVTNTFVVPSDITVNEFLYIQFPANKVITFYVTGIQLELGKVATPFEHRSYGEELALCQRYYQRFDADGQDFTNIGIAIATNSAWYVPIILPGGRMRADPALSYSAVGDFRVTLQHSNTDAVTSMMIGYGNPLHPNLSVQAGSNSASNGARMFGYGSSTTAWLAFDAEL
jgi:hypothetical protein